MFFNSTPSVIGNMASLAIRHKINRSLETRYCGLPMYLLHIVTSTRLIRCFLPQCDLTYCKPDPTMTMASGRHSSHYLIDLSIPVVSRPPRAPRPRRSSAITTKSPKSCWNTKSFTTGRGCGKWRVPPSVSTPPSSSDIRNRVSYDDDGDDDGDDEG